jgi:hypothetical protein
MRLKKTLAESQETPDITAKEPFQPTTSSKVTRWIQKAAQAAALSATMLAPQASSAHEGHDHTPSPEVNRMTHSSYSMQGNFNLHTGCNTFQPLIAIQGQQSSSEFRHRLEHDNCLDIHGYLAVERTLMGIYLNDGAIQASADNYLIFHSALEFPILSTPIGSLKVGVGFGLEYRLTGSNPYTVLHLGPHGEFNAERLSIQLEFVPELIRGTEIPLHEAKLSISGEVISEILALGFELTRRTYHPSNDRNLYISEHLVVNSISATTEVRLTGNFCLSGSVGAPLKFRGIDVGIGFGQCSDLMAPHNHNHGSHSHGSSHTGSTETAPQQPSHEAHCHTHRDGTVHCGGH